MGMIAKHVEYNDLLSVYFCGPVTDVVVYELWVRGGKRSPKPGSFSFFKMAFPSK